MTVSIITHLTFGKIDLRSVIQFGGISVSERKSRVKATVFSRKGIELKLFFVCLLVTVFGLLSLIKRKTEAELFRDTCRYSRGPVTSYHLVDTLKQFEREFVSR